MQRKRSDEPGHKKARMAQFQQKLTLILFFDPCCGNGKVGVILEKCRHCFLYRNAPKIENLYPKVEATKLWAENLFMLHHNNASSHRADSTRKFLEENNMWLTPHPPYFPDLAPWDFFIFLKLKLALKRQHLGELERIKSKTAVYLRSILKSDFKRCYDDWLLRLRKCIATQGEYCKGDKINL